MKKDSRKYNIYHGVMAALQFLVLSVEVRILVRQLNNPERDVNFDISFFII